MADIVLGIGSSHTPQISSPIELWPDHAERDRRNSELLGADGEFHTYEALLAVADPAIEPELREEVWRSKRERADAAFTVLTERLRAADPDVVVVVGDDQRELFGDEALPAIAMCLGDELIDLPPSAEQLARIPAGIRAAQWARHARVPDAYPVATELSAFLADRLVEGGFDIAQMRGQVPTRSLGHAFTLVRHRLGLAPQVPIVPVFLNTFYGPTVPTPARCYALGKALRVGLDAWTGSERVAVVASGGLSHYVVLEEFDNTVLDAMKARDAARLCALPRRYFRSGTSEILNWIAAFGIVEDLEMRLVDYIAGYRSPAGTGTGIAFALWEP
ncbi:MAG TPA: hypothetical protein VMU75_12750 [Acidimicrobiales bacterium]|nr:hypothetical protein [Acidimicrobiales bacterium]